MKKVVKKLLMWYRKWNVLELTFSTKIWSGLPNIAILFSAIFGAKDNDGPEGIKPGFDSK